MDECLSFGMCICKYACMYVHLYMTTSITANNSHQYRPKYLYTHLVYATTIDNLTYVQTYKGQTHTHTHGQMLQQDLQRHHCHIDHITTTTSLPKKPLTSISYIVYLKRIFYGLDCCVWWCPYCDDEQILNCGQWTDLVKLQLKCPYVKIVTIDKRNGKLNIKGKTQ